MPLSQLIAASTVNAARVFPPILSRRVTLNVVSPSDLAIMELR